MAEDRFGNYVAGVEPPPAPYPLSPCACRPLDGGGSGACTEADLIADEFAPGFAFEFVANGDFILEVGADGMIRTSEDGVTWTAQTSAATLDLYAASFGNGFYLIGGHAEPGFSPQLYKSLDGVTWIPTEALGDADSSINGLAFGNGVHVAVVAQPSGDGQIRNSTDGAAWPTTTVIPGQLPNGVFFGGGVFLIVGDDDLIMTSVDGEDWMTRNSGTSGVEFFEAAYGDGVWVATSDDTATVYRSTDDGVTWAAVSVPEAMHGIDFGGGLFVMQAASGGAIYTSPDGLAWTLAEPVGGNVSLLRFYKDCTFIKTN